MTELGRDGCQRLRARKRVSLQPKHPTWLTKQEDMTNKDKSERKKEERTTL